jgi:hypothetical protein
LNSGPSPWATPSALFLWRIFRDRISWTICPAWPWTTILLISAFWVARITNVSHWLTGTQLRAILNKQKHLFFFFKNWEQEDIIGLIESPIGSWYQWEGGIYKEGCRSVNVVGILCTHVWKWKNETCWGYFRNGVWGVKENDGGSESNYDIC